MTLEKLYQIIEDCKSNMPKESYVASLFRDGKDSVIQKVGEEATEVVIAAKNEGKERIVAEVADLWFHTLVLLCANNIKLKEVLRELETRNYRK